MQSARALALVHGRDYVIPGDLRALVKDAFRHRLVLTYQALAEERTADDVLDAVIAAVPQPRLGLGGPRPRDPRAEGARRRADTVPSRPGPVPESLLKALELTVARRVDGMLATTARRCSGAALARPRCPLGPGTMSG